METETPAEATSDALERFSGVQVYVHGTIAISIFVLYLTGLPMTFNDQLGWLFSVVGYGNVVLLHIVAGVVLITAGTFYLFYLLLTAGLSGRLLPSLPTLGIAREAVAYLKFVAGRGEKPSAGKYNWLQTAEIWVISLELVLLSVTGLLLWFRGIFVAPEFRAALGGHEPLADVLLLIVRDIHVVIALTALMGIMFHLYVVNVKEKYPFNDTMFSGKVSPERAAHHWEDWAEENLESTPEHGSASGPNRRTLVGVTLTLLVFFALVLLATLFASVLSPLPTREYLLVLPFDPFASSAVGLVFLLGLNLIVLGIIAATGLMCYGLAKRLRGEYR